MGQYDRLQAGLRVTDMSVAGLRRAYVVKGAYPERLLEEWDLFDEERGSESARPGQPLPLVVQRISS